MQVNRAERVLEPVEVPGTLRQLVTRRGIPPTEGDSYRV